MLFKHIQFWSKILHWVNILEIYDIGSISSRTWPGTLQGWVINIVICINL